MRADPRHIALSALGIAVLVLLVARQAPAETAPLLSARFVERYHQMSIIHGQEAIRRAGDLTRAAEGLLAQPDFAALERCREAWLASHAAYIKSRFFLALATRTSGGELPSIEELDGLVDAWPIEEGYIDAIEGYPTSGIVYDLSLPLDEATLRAQHGLTATEEVALGFHPIEFLLWARTPEEFAAATQLSPGQQADGMHLAELPGNRRRALLLLLTRLLEDDIGREFRTLVQQPSDSTRPSALADDLNGEVTRAWRRLRHHLVGSVGGTVDGDHSRISGTSLQDLANEARAIVSLLGTPGEFAGELARLNPDQAKRYLADAGMVLDRIERLATGSFAAGADNELDARLVHLIQVSERFSELVHAAVSR